MISWKFTFAGSSGSFWVAAAASIAACVSRYDTAACVLAVIMSILSAVMVEVRSIDSGLAGGSATKRSINGNVEHVVDNVTYPSFNPTAVTPGNLIINSRTRRATIRYAESLAGGIELSTSSRHQV
ncbi:uncharacterized protein V1513DRAFT_455478 [Lipomyces chichibuensis]|uniref:uncharacterized protein n=1 Tax=Lipomyces chichibuensis TaxID=1546026 RepID=UPI0033432563